MIPHKCIRCQVPTEFGPMCPVCESDCDEMEFPGECRSPILWIPIAILVGSLIATAVFFLSR